MWNRRQSRLFAHLVLRAPHAAPSVGTSRCDVPVAQRSAGATEPRAGARVLRRSLRPRLRSDADGAARRPYQVQGFKARILWRIPTPALSSSRRRRGRIVRRFLEKSRDWIGRTVCRKSKTHQCCSFSLGEKVRMRASVNINFFVDDVALVVNDNYSFPPATIISFQ